MYLCVPFLPAFFLGLFSSPRTRRETLFTQIPVAGFTASWALLSSDTNIEMRFQYAVLPLVLIAWPALLANLWEDWKLPRWHSLSLDAQRRARALVMVTSAIVLLWQSQRTRTWHRAAIATSTSLWSCGLSSEGIWHRHQRNRTGPPVFELAGSRHLRNYDRELAHGADLSQRLDDFEPQIIELQYSVGWKTPFQLMIRRLKNYADQKGYRLATAFGSDTTDIYYDYVQPGLADVTRSRVGS